jgi:hypothetical protein
MIEMGVKISPKGKPHQPATAESSVYGIPAPRTLWPGRTSTVADLRNVMTRAEMQ